MLVVALLAVVLIFNEGTEGDVPVVVDEQCGLGLRVHDDLVDLGEDVLLGGAAEVALARRFLRPDDVPRGVVPRPVGLVFAPLALLLALDDHEVALDLLLELGGDIGLVDLLRGGLVLDAVEQRVILLLLVERLELVLERLLVVVGLLVALQDAGFFLVGGEDLGQAAVVGLGARSGAVVLVGLEQRQHEEPPHAVRLF